MRHLFLFLTLSGILALPTAATTEPNTTVFVDIGTTTAVTPKTCANPYIEVKSRRTEPESTGWTDSF
jgi:hypothetical protein